MKKVISAVILLTMIASLTACSSKPYSPKPLAKEGIAPYQFSEKEKFLLESFGMDGSALMVSFNAPKEAISLNVNAYRHEDGGKWLNIGGGGISIDTEQFPTDELDGNFTMQLKENYVIDFSINANGRAAYKTNEIVLDSGNLSSVRGLLPNLQTIEMNTEIPVAFMIYDDAKRMESYSLQDYFEPSKFDGMKLVQFVTLEFSDK